MAQPVVVLRPGALGDTLLTLPALAALRRARPDAPRTFVGRADCLPLITAAGLATGAYDYAEARWAGLFSTTPAPALASVVHGADVVAWLPDAEGALARRLRALGATAAWCGLGPTAEHAEEHAALALLRSLAPLGITAPASVEALLPDLPPLCIPPPAAQAAEALRQRLLPGAGRVVALHPGSGGSAKRWPAEHVGRLAALLAARGARPLLLAGEADLAVARAAQRAAGPAGTVPLATGLRVVELAALLHTVSAYVGNDSGVSHLAALLGVPTVALFGPTRPARWRPLGPRVRVVAAPGGELTALTPDAVLAALDDVLP